jgi:hypothetical protein
MRSLSIAVAATALSQLLLSVDAFAPSSSHRHNNAAGHIGIAPSASSKTTAIRSTVLPIPTANDLMKQQPELDEDDLYLTPEPPRAGAVMKMLPKETWDIDTPTSLFYFAVDLLAVASTMGFLNAVVTSDIYHALPVWAQAMAVAPLQVLTGFAMW